MDQKFRTRTSGTMHQLFFLFFIQPFANHRFRLDQAIGGEILHEFQERHVHHPLGPAQHQLNRVGRFMY